MGKFGMQKTSYSDYSISKKIVAGLAIILVLCTIISIYIVQYQLLSICYLFVHTLAGWSGNDRPSSLNANPPIIHVVGRCGTSSLKSTLPSGLKVQRKKALLEQQIDEPLSHLLQVVGRCKPLWDIGIWIIFSGILGYYLSEIGIFGYPCGIWDIGILVSF